MGVYKEYWQGMFLMDGTATRTQYWIPQIVNYFVLILYTFITQVGKYYNFRTGEIIELNGPVIGWLLLSLLIWIANFTIRARRLHDTGRSNWWILWYLLPGIGAIIIFILLVLPTKRNPRWTVNQSELLNG